MMFRNISGRIPPAFSVSTSAIVSIAAVAANEISSPPTGLMVTLTEQRDATR
ncbi:hypothetical protein ACVIRO_006937 [Rhizobium ruizarguesonis]|jgi:hypothetical protein